MTKTFRSLVAATAAAAALSLVTLAAASPASAAVTQVPSGTQLTGNWAGYYAVPANGKGPESVFATFTVPKVSCKQSIGPNPTYGSIWAGIGGMMNDVSNGKQAWLEQDGIEITCKTRGSQPVYNPFWEIVRPSGGSPYGNPYDSVIFQDASGHDATVSPGDQISLSVFDGSYQKVRQFGFTVTVGRDSSNPVDYAKSAFLPPTAYTGRTAEVITEHPSGASLLQGDLAATWFYQNVLRRDPPSAGLVNMGDVHYSEAMYLTHLPGDVKPEGVPVTQYRSVLGTDLETNPYHQQRVFIYPGGAYPTVSGSSVKDGFSTYYYIP
jgi:Peptidase A4 family